MLKNYSGIITVGGIQYNCTAALANIGRSLSGSIVIEGSAGSVIRVNGSLNDPLTKFSCGSFQFVTPDLDLISVAAIAEGSTSFAPQPHYFAVSLIPITVNGSGAVMSWSMSDSAAAAVAHVGDGADELSSSTGVVLPLSPIRIDHAIHPVDNMARLVSLERRGEESNQSLRRRTLDNIRKNKGSTKEGVAEAVISSLGLLSEEVIRITVRDAAVADPAWIRMTINNEYLRIYSEYIDEDSFTLEIEADIHGLSVQGLIDVINQSANYAAAKIMDSEPPFYRDYDSVALRSRTYPSAERIKLTRTGRVVPGSIILSSNRSHTKQVDESSIARYGDWAVDNENAIMTSYTPLDDDVRISFLEAQSISVIHSSECRVADFSAKDGRRTLFNQSANSIYSTVDEMTEEALPTDYGYDILGDIMNSGYGHFWGK